MISLELTTNEVCYAAFHGIMRRKDKLDGLRSDREQGCKSTWENEIEGACAELAYCKSRGWYWSGLTAIRTPDAGRVEIRWTRREGTGGLIIYRTDHNDTPCLLLDGFAPHYRVIGWLYAREGKLEKFLEPEGYFLVPRKLLRPLEK